MPKFSVGDTVIYNDRVYWIVRGPTNGALGATYEVSEIPPPLKVIESELRECPAGYEEVGTPGPPPLGIDKSPSWPRYHKRPRPDGFPGST